MDIWIKEPKTEPEKWINDFMKEDENMHERLRSKFMNGYCYFFANMLKTAFGRGVICWTAPHGHFVWLDTKEDPDRISSQVVNASMAYDIEGVYNINNHETYYLIPESFLGSFISDFMHTETAERKGYATKQDLIRIVKDYCNKTGTEYDSSIEGWFIDV